MNQSRDQRQDETEYHRQTAITKTFQHEILIHQEARIVFPFRPYSVLRRLGTWCRSFLALISI
ncbi:Uncharacterized protein DAT39_022943 [Clarias magur]|uniref:Uncharacterized protein n=1 Tax=Clarias magur TaxID=1594786 RepID=A0A8J4TAA7_CLAMG|nr:Uncharacterized protein DAT39_022943 [Clarias magur]